MKRILILLQLLALVLLISSCSKTEGKGDVVSETRTVSSFSGVSLCIDATVYVSEDSVNTLRLEAQQNILDIIETPVEDGTLVLKVKSHHIIGSHDPIVVYITSTDLHKLNISGSGNINVQQGLHQPVIDLSVSGSGNIDVPEIIAHDMSATVSGSGNIKGRGGVVDYAHLNISGSGNMNFSSVSADTVYAVISGSGDITLNVNKLLDGTISGSGNIRYYGNPVVNSHISGSGSIVHL
jgi:hypothetical protein